ncbi:MAG: hypothetical protein ACR2IK_18540 [Chloroflexota bacterium]
MLVYIVELVRPGARLRGLRAAEARDAEALLDLLESSLTDAALGLSLFNQALAAVLDSAIAPRASMEDWKRDARFRAALRARLLPHVPPDLSSEARWAAVRQIDERVEIEVKRQRWSAGQLPRSYTHRLPLLHAKSFLYALDTVLKALAQLAHIEGVPARVETELANYRSAFPSLKDVRDSAHHVEDRVHGKARNKKLVLKPVQNAAISAPTGGALIVDMLNGN